MIKALKIGLGIQLAIVFIEIILQLFAPQELMTPIFAKDLGLPIALRKNAEGIHVTPEFSVHYKVNSMNMRAEDISLEKEVGVFRTIVIGDSFAFGLGIESEDTFIKVIERELNRERGVQKSEVINGACPGWSTAHELAFMENLGFRLQPDIVILCVHDDDPKDNRLVRRFVLEEGNLVQQKAPGWDEVTITSYSQQIPFYIFLRERSHLFSTFSAKMFNYIQTMKTGSRNGVTAFYVKGKKAEAKWPEKDWLLTSALIGELKEACFGHSSRLVIVHLPSYFLNRAVEARIKKIGQRWDIPFLGLIDHLGKASSKKQYYFKANQHFNKAGHELIGQQIAVFVKSLLQDKQIIKSSSEH